MVAEMARVTREGGSVAEEGGLDDEGTEREFLDGGHSGEHSGANPPLAGGSKLRSSFG